MTDIWGEGTEAIRSHARKLTERVEVLEEALRWYARSDSYRNAVIEEKTPGERARKALVYGGWGRD
jgi:hypothetical protein